MRTLLDSNIPFKPFNQSRVVKFKHLAEAGQNHEYTSPYKTSRIGRNIFYMDGERTSNSR